MGISKKKKHGIITVHFQKTIVYYGNPKKKKKKNGIITVYVHKACITIVNPKNIVYHCICSQACIYHGKSKKHSIITVYVHKAWIYYGTMYKNTIIMVNPKKQNKNMV